MEMVVTPIRDFIAISGNTRFKVCYPVGWDIRIREFIKGSRPHPRPFQCILDRSGSCWNRNVKAGKSEEQNKTCVHMLIYVAIEKTWLSAKPEQQNPNYQQ